VIKLVDLSVLTIPYLESLADECNIHLKSSSRKAEKIKTIQDAGIPEEKLSKLVEKYLERKKKRKKLKEKIPSKILNLEERMNSLEQKLDSLVSKLGEIKKENYILSEISTLSEQVKPTNIKEIIKANILPGEIITVDKLIHLKELQNFPLVSLEQAITQLIEEKTVDVLEGGSICKIKGNIGRLMRKELFH
jgi:ferritin-like metal-binding protein YciE